MNRKNFVVTSQKDWFYEGVEICNDLIVALKSAEKHALLTSCDEVFVIGGSSLYKNCINFAKKIIVSDFPQRAVTLTLSIVSDTCLRFQCF